MFIKNFHSLPLVAKKNFYRPETGNTFTFDHVPRHPPPPPLCSALHAALSRTPPHPPPGCTMPGLSLPGTISKLKSPPVPGPTLPARHRHKATLHGKRNKAPCVSGSGSSSSDRRRKPEPSGRPWRRRRRRRRKWRCRYTCRSVQGVGSASRAKTAAAPTPRSSGRSAPGRSCETYAGEAGRGGRDHESCGVCLGTHVRVRDWIGWGKMGGWVWSGGVG